jgi:hypothetical protein
MSRFSPVCALSTAALMLTASLGFATPVRDQLGVWEATRVNKGPLPMTDQVVGKDGLTHAVRLHSMTIRFQKNGRFSAALKYRRAILSKKEKIEAQPLLNDTWVGSYTQTGTRMRFVPEKRGDQQVQPFEGQSAGRRITVSFDYEIVTKKHYVLDLDKNDNIF